MCKFKELVEHIAKNSIRLVNLSMGSNKLKDWVCFKKVVSKFKDIIFVVSAGNNGFNIDETPIYPASLDLQNILTCLLYTSPSPRDSDSSRMPSSA